MSMVIFTLHFSLTDTAGLDKSHIHHVLHVLSLLLCLLLWDTTNMLNAGGDDWLVWSSVRLQSLLPDAAKLLQVELWALNVVTGDHGDNVIDVWLVGGFEWMRPLKKKKKWKEKKAHHNKKGQSQYESRERRFIHVFVTILCPISIFAQGADGNPQHTERQTDVCERLGVQRIPHKK